ncbi:hypothetical protein QFZ55_001947 [Streptomyces luteogriseus]|uniref:hypothetical protein n=1 Tax=Streptomyces luteogriseus TaxID=68233 RepID=UPI0027844B94|nr:hypothetical protein [Streptomyces luteogriseus]MDQ0712495.1 hypothetical protein [Streptomyces luteogriseus]
MSMRRDVHEEVRSRLHEAAGAHEPDRERMLARVERGMAGPAVSGHRATHPPAFGWMRVAGATAAVAGVLAVGGYAVASAVKDEAAPQQREVATSATPTPSPEATSRAPAPPAPVEPTPSRSPERRTSGPPPPRTPSAPATERPPAATEDGPLWSDGSVDPHSNDFWAQSNITLKTRGQLTALTVRLKVAQTGGVSNAGAWRSLPEGDFTLAVAEQDGFLVYTWTLKEGRTVPAGEWVFAGQFDHARGGRDAGKDAYSVTATAASRQLSVGGGFAAVDDGDGDS